jgi:DNA-binding NtrC family response regulator
VEKRIRVLLVEDDVGVRVGLASVLELEAEVTECGAAEQASLLLGDHEYEVVCADYGLPGMSGLELLEKLDSKGSPTRGLLITGSEDYYQVSTRKGFHVLLKPVDTERLCALVRHLASLAQMKRAVGVARRG